LIRGYRRQLDFAWVGSGEPVAAGAVLVCSRTSR
jgi:hypothetical protein